MNQGDELDVLLEAETAPAAAEEFKFATLPPEISFQTAKVPPPAWLYVGPDDQLLINVFSALPNRTVQASIRVLFPDGHIGAHVELLQLTGGYIHNYYWLRLAESFLIGVTFLALNVPTPPGTIWLRCLLVRGGGSGMSFPQMLVSGYVAAWSGLTWPYPRFQNPVEGPGRLRIITGTDPAPAFEILEAVPTGARWRLLALRATLVTDATLGDRFVHLYFDDGATTWWRGTALFTHTAGGIANYNWAIGVNPRSGLPPWWIQDALPDNITLAAGWRFRTDVIGKQAGDNWGAPVYYVEEWVDP